MRISDWSSDVCSSDLAGDDASARIAYANALRAARGDAIEQLPAQRDLRQKNYDHAVTEERDEHGLPPPPEEPPPTGCATRSDGCGLSASHARQSSPRAGTYASPSLRRSVWRTASRAV